MERLRAKFSTLEYKGLAAIILVFAVITVILFLERSGIQYQYGKLSLSFMPNEATMPKAEALEQVPKDCLLLYSSGIEESSKALEEFEMILTDMKVGHDTVDIAKVDDYDFHDYTTVILLINNLSRIISLKVNNSDISRLRDARDTIAVGQQGQVLYLLVEP